MNVSYGPPSVGGVTTLMHVGDEDGNTVSAANIHRVSGTVGLIAVGVWAYAYLAKDEKTQNYAFAASAISFVARLATRPK